MLKQHVIQFAIVLGMVVTHRPLVLANGTTSGPLLQRGGVLARMKEGVHRAKARMYLSRNARDLRNNAGLVGVLGKVASQSVYSMLVDLHKDVDARGGTLLSPDVIELALTGQARRKLGREMGLGPLSLFRNRRIDALYAHAVTQTYNHSQLVELLNTGTQSEAYFALRLDLNSKGDLTVNNLGWPIRFPALGVGVSLLQSAETPTGEPPPNFNFTTAHRPFEGPLGPFDLK